MAIGLSVTDRGFRILIIGHAGGPSAETLAAYVYRKVIAARRRFDGDVDREEQSRRRLIYQEDGE